MKFIKKLVNLFKEEKENKEDKVERTESYHNNDIDENEEELSMSSKFKKPVDYTKLNNDQIEKLVEERVDQYLLENNMEPKSREAIDFYIRASLRVEKYGITVAHVDRPKGLYPIVFYCEEDDLVLNIAVLMQAQTSFFRTDDLFSDILYKKMGIFIEKQIDEVGEMFQRGEDMTDVIVAINVIFLYADIVNLNYIMIKEYPDIFGVKNCPTLFTPDHIVNEKGMSNDGNMNKINTFGELPLFINVYEPITPENKRLPLYYDRPLDIHSKNIQLSSIVTEMMRVMYQSPMIKTSVINIIKPGFSHIDAYFEQIENNIDFSVISQLVVTIDDYNERYVNDEFLELLYEDNDYPLHENVALMIQTLFLVKDSRYIFKIIDDEIQSWCDDSDSELYIEPVVLSLIYRGSELITYGEHSSMILPQLTTNNTIKSISKRYKFIAMTILHSPSSMHDLFSYWDGYKPHLADREFYVELIEGVRKGKHPSDCWIRDMFNILKFIKKQTCVTLG